MWKNFNADKTLVRRKRARSMQFQILSEWCQKMADYYREKAKKLLDYDS